MCPPGTERARGSSERQDPQKPQISRLWTHWVPEKARTCSRAYSKSGMGPLTLTPCSSHHFSMRQKLIEYLLYALPSKSSQANTRETTKYYQIVMHDGKERIMGYVGGGSCLGRLRLLGRRNISKLGPDVRRPHTTQGQEQCSK